MGKVAMLVPAERVGGGAGASLTTAETTLRDILLAMPEVDQVIFWQQDSVVTDPDVGLLAVTEDSSGSTMGATHIADPRGFVTFEYGNYIPMNMGTNAGTNSGTDTFVVGTSHPINSNGSPSSIDPYDAAGAVSTRRLTTAQLVAGYTNVYAINGVPTQSVVFAYNAGVTHASAGRRVGIGILAASMGSITTACEQMIQRAALWASDGALATEPEPEHHEGTGTIVAIASLSATGEDTTPPTGDHRTGTGSVSAEASLTASGTKGGLGQASTSAVASVTASGTKHGIGNGVLEWVGVLTASGTAAQVASGTGTIAAEASLTAAGSKHAIGSGAIAAAADLGASGTKGGEGTGTITATASLTATGSAPNTGTGRLSATATLTAAGTKHATGSASIAASATLTASGSAPESPDRAGTGSIAATVSLTASGRKAAGGTASITAVVTLSAGGSTEPPRDIGVSVYLLPSPWRATLASGGSVLATSSEYVTIEVRSSVPLDSQPVAIALADRDDPVEWQSAQWSGEGWSREETWGSTTATVYYRRALIGPVDMSERSGNVRVLAKVTDSPEVPVLSAGTVYVEG